MVEHTRINADPHGDEMLDAEDAARYLKINVQTLRRLAREQQIPSFKVGGSWRFMRSRLDRWAESQQQARRPSVLVIDDEDVVRTFISRVLEGQGFRVTGVSNGQDGLAWMGVNTPDLVILDLMMPDMNGAETLKLMRQRWDFIPVIIITGYPDSELMSQALRFSPFALLPKPASPDQLTEAVRWAVGGDHASGQMR